jgi:hypothetical protein
MQAKDKILKIQGGPNGLRCWCYGNDRQHGEASKIIQKVSRNDNGISTGCADIAHRVGHVSIEPPGQRFFIHVLTSIGLSEVSLKQKAHRLLAREEPRGGIE